MKVRNYLPVLLEQMERWKEPPGLREFAADYARLLEGFEGTVFSGAKHFHAAARELDWPSYRERVLTLDPEGEERRLNANITRVEELFHFKLEGEAILFGAFEVMDGFARFDRGSHRVYLGVDESHDKGDYLDILETHELTHVARESRPEVWRGWGLDPRMSHDEFGEKQPTVEHLFGEGFSCAVSEILIRSGASEPWNYAYQTEEGLARILAHAEAVDLAIHREFEKGEDGDWSRLYHPGTYRPRLPIFAHYVWGWQWARQLIQKSAGGDPARLVTVCSKEFLEDAMKFELAKMKSGPGA